MGDKCTWWAPQASTLIDGFADKAVGGSIPSSSRHLFLTYFKIFYPKSYFMTLNKMVKKVLLSCFVENL